MSENKNEENKKQDSKKHEPKAERSQLQNIIRTYRSEFLKIVWPSRETLIKHTITVVAVSLMFGIYIAITDGIFGALFSRFVQLVS